jgi:hypothetical protein
LPPVFAEFGSLELICVVKGEPQRRNHAVAATIYGGKLRDLGDGSRGARRSSDPSSAVGFSAYCCRRRPSLRR